MSRTAAFDLDWIVPDLAVGGALAPGAAARLAAELGVGWIVDMREEACDDAAELASAGVRFLQLPTTDLQAPSQAQLDKGVAFADAARAQAGRLLVHCQHGVGRSATLALCILVERGMAPLAALTRAKDLRWQVSPSPAQYEAWAQWVSRRRPTGAFPDFEAFKVVAYRHLTREA